MQRCVNVEASSVEKVGFLSAFSIHRAMERVERRQAGWEGALKIRPNGMRNLSQDRGVQPHARQELSMSDNSISLLRQRMIEDMTARRLIDTS